MGSSQNPRQFLDDNIIGHLNHKLGRSYSVCSARIQSCYMDLEAPVSAHLKLDFAIPVPQQLMKLHIGLQYLIPVHLALSM